MKKLFALFVLIITFSCKNVEQYKGAITELDSKWETSTAVLNSISTMLEASKAAQKENLDNLKIDSSFMSKVKKTDVEKITNALNSYNLSGAELDKVTTQLEELKSNWTSKATEVKALTEGLTKGKLEGDVTAKIAELTNFLTTSQTTMNTLKETINSTALGSKSTFDALKASVASYMKN